MSSRRQLEASERQQRCDDPYKEGDTWNHIRRAASDIQRDVIGDDVIMQFGRDFGRLTVCFAEISPVNNTSTLDCRQALEGDSLVSAQRTHATVADTMKHALESRRNCKGYLL